MKRAVCILIASMMVFSFSGCAKHFIYEVVSSSPQGAEIYWGKTKSEMAWTPFTTLNSRFMEGDQWESWCYQVRKPGYLASDIICRPEGDENRTLTFNLTKIKTLVTSDPPDAQIYWGESRDALLNAHQSTPWTEDGANANTKANFANWYFQVKKAGYKDSEIVFAPLTEKDRTIHFTLEPID